MTAEYSFRVFTPTQEETLDRTIQAFRDYLDTLKACLAYRGGIHWKKIKGREYLYKYRDRFGHGESLGPRSPATERLFDEFGRERRELVARRNSQREHLAMAGRFCRAALLNRVPENVIRIVHRLEQGGLPGVLVMVIDTHALYAYEFAAGVFIEASMDSPLRSGAGQKLTLAAASPVSTDQFLGLLRQADRSFEIFSGNGCEAINKMGFGVRLIRPRGIRTQPRPIYLETPGVTVPAESGDLAYLLSAPKFSQIVIGKRGTPATMAVPDPRALALHKLWLSQQEDRRPMQKVRDRMQALALAELIVRFLPQYHFFSSQLNLFPNEVVRHAAGLVEGYEVSPELDLD